MGIEDINISEELETNAPSIKYTGNEGPKSPQEEQMMMLIQKLMSQGMGQEEAMQMAQQMMAQGEQQQMAQQQMPRQMAAFGGIMGLDGRRQYGIGSSLKKFVRKVIPNEVAKVAEVAAPFVAPFNPALAAAMSGIGGFDRTGRIGSSIKSGLKTYALGQGARYLGGADFQGNPFSTDGGAFRGGLEGFKGGFSKPTGSGGIKNLFADKSGPQYTGTDSIGSGSDGLTSLTTAPGERALTLEQMADFNKIQPKNLGETASIFQKIKDFALDNKLLTGLAAGTLGAGALMGNMEPDEIQDLQRGEGLDIEGIRTEVIEAMKDETGEKLKAIRIKYPFLGTQRSKNQAAMAMGGRIGYMGGGMTMGDPRMMAPQSQMPMMAPQSRMPAAEGGLMDLGGMEKDYRAEGGFVPIGAKEKADDVPARLSVNEFVFTADAVRSAGGGDIDRGAEVMENMMKNLEQGGQVSEESQGMQGAQQMFETSERLSEVV